MKNDLKSEVLVPAGLLLAMAVAMFCAWHC